MKTLRPSLAWQVIIFLALLIGAQPLVPPVQIELSSRHDDKLLAPKQALETAVTGLSGKKDFSKFTLAGLVQGCPVAVQLTGTILPVSFVGRGPQASVLGFSHNRSPPILPL